MTSNASRKLISITEAFISKCLYGCTKANVHVHLNVNKSSSQLVVGMKKLLSEIVVSDSSKKQSQ